MTTFQEIIETDLRDFNELTVMLINGVSKSCLLETFRGRHPLVGTSIPDYIDELLGDGLIEEKDGLLRYKKGCSPI